MAKQRLKDLDVWEVSTVDNPAHDKKFLIMKREGTAPLIKSVEGGKLKVLGGLWIKAQITDDEIWSHIENEYVTAFSWCGRPIKELLDFSENGYKVTLIESEILDISVVTVPGDVGALLKIIDKEKRIIEGMVATDVMNRNYSKILPSVFEKAMVGYMANPPKGVMFYNHNWDRPVGKILEYKVEKSTEGGEEEMAEFMVREKRGGAAPALAAEETKPAEQPKPAEVPIPAVKSEMKPPEKPPEPKAKVEGEGGDEGKTGEVKILEKLDTVTAGIKSLTDAVMALVEKLGVEKKAELKPGETPAPAVKPEDVEKRLEVLEKIMLDHLPVRKGAATSKDRPQGDESKEFRIDAKKHPGDVLRDFLGATSAKGE